MKNLNFARHQVARDAAIGSGSIDVQMTGSENLEFCVANVGPTVHVHFEQVDGDVRISKN